MDVAKEIEIHPKTLRVAQFGVISRKRLFLARYCTHTTGTGTHWLWGNGIYLISSYVACEAYGSEHIYGMYCQNV